MSSSMFAGGSFADAGIRTKPVGDILPFPTFWLKTLKKWELSLAAALLEGISNSLDAYQRDLDFYAANSSGLHNHITITHDDTGHGWNLFSMTDSTRVCMDEMALMKLHEAFTGNDDAERLVGHHGLGFYLLIFRLMGRHADDGWAVMSSPQNVPSLYVAECSFGAISKNMKPEVYTIANNKSHASVDMYLKHLARHKGTEFRSRASIPPDEWMKYMADAHGTVIVVKTSRDLKEEFSSLLKLYKAQVIPSLGRQLLIRESEVAPVGGFHRAQDAPAPTTDHIKFIVDGKTIPLRHESFTNPDEYLEVKLHLMGTYWSIINICFRLPQEYEGDVVGPFLFRGDREKVARENLLQGHLTRLAYSLPRKMVSQGEVITIRVSVRCGDIERVRKLVSHPYTEKEYFTDEDILKIEGVMLGIKTGLATTFLGRVNRLDMYPSRQNFIEEFQLPASLSFDEAEKEQLHLATVVTGPWVKACMDVRPIKEKSCLSGERGLPYKFKSTIMRMIHVMQKYISIAIQKKDHGAVKPQFTDSEEEGEEDGVAEALKKESPSAAAGSGSSEPAVSAAPHPIKLEEESPSVAVASSSSEPPHAPPPPIKQTAVSSQKRKTSANEVISATQKSAPLAKKQRTQRRAQYRSLEKMKKLCTEMKNDLSKKNKEILFLTQKLKLEAQAAERLRDELAKARMISEQLQRQLDELRRASRQAGMA